MLSRYLLVNVSVLNKFRFVAVLTAMTSVFWGNVHPTMAAEKTIDDISPEIFACLKRNTEDGKGGYIDYRDHNEIKVGNRLGSATRYYEYNESQKTITLRGGNGGSIHVLEKTQQGIKDSAAKCRSGEYR